MVPDVILMNYAEAESAIVSGGLVVGIVRHGYSQTVPASAVMEQVPSAGELVPPGSAVNLTISNGNGQGPDPQPANPMPTHESVDISVETVFAWDVRFTEGFGDGVSDGWVERPGGTGLWIVDVDPLSGSLAYRLSGIPTTPAPWRLAAYSILGSFWSSDFQSRQAETTNTEATAIVDHFGYQDDLHYYLRVRQ